MNWERDLRTGVKKRRKPLNKRRGEEGRKLEWEEEERRGYYVISDPGSLFCSRVFFLIYKTMKFVIVFSFIGMVLGNKENNAMGYEVGVRENWYSIDFNI